MQIFSPKRFPFGTWNLLVADSHYPRARGRRNISMRNCTPTPFTITIILSNISEIDLHADPVGDLVTVYIPTQFIDI
jgi:hypothetical protein